jgi:hypothetical protein
MSALDDIIAQDSAPQQASPLDAIIARDAAQQAQASSTPPPAQPQAPAPQGSQPGMLASFGAGLGKGFGSTVLGAQELLGKGLQAVGSDHVGPWLVNDAQTGVRNMNAQNQPYAAANPITNAVGNIGGNIAATAPLSALAPASATATALGRVGTGAALGAASGAMTPSDQSNQESYWDQKLGQTGTGAAFGAGGAVLANALGRAISGYQGNAQRTLANAGVQMTPGQIIGGGAARTEEKLTSVPIVGDMIKNAQQRSVQSFNRATYNEALAPIGAQVAPDIPVGSDAIAAVRNEIGHVYDSITPRASFVADQNFAGDLAGIRANLSQTAPGTLPQFDNIVQHQITDKLSPQQALTGTQWANTRSEINGIARNQVLGNATPDNRSLADALGQLNDAVNAGVARSSPPDILPTLQNANAAWARYKQIETAAGMAGASNNGNVFTAAQFANAVRRGSTSAQKATNSGLNGQLGASAQEVLGSKYPDSGTPGRAALMGILGALGGGGAAAAGFGAPTLAAGAAAGMAALPYTGLGQRATQALLMSRPAGAEAVGNFVGQRVSPFAAALGAALVNH